MSQTCFRVKEELEKPVLNYLWISPQLLTFPVNNLSYLASSFVSYLLYIKTIYLSPFSVISFICLYLLALLVFLMSLAKRHSSLWRQGAELFYKSLVVLWNERGAFFVLFFLFFFPLEPYLQVTFIHEWPSQGLPFCNWKCNLSLQSNPASLTILLFMFL